MAPATQEVAMILVKEKNGNSIRSLFFFLQALCGFLAFLIYSCVLAEFSWLLLHALRVHGKMKNLFAAAVNIEVIYNVIGWGRFPC